MKRCVIFFLLVLSILFVNSMALAEEQVVVFYEGFENVVEGTRPDGWINIGELTWYVSTLQAQAGQKSFFIEDTTEEAYIGAISPSISVSPNTTYTVAFWAMTTDDTESQGHIGVLIEGVSEWLYVPDDRPLEWTLATLTFTTSSTTESIKIRLYPTARGGAGAIGRAWYDEIYLVEGEEFVPPQP